MSIVKCKNKQTGITYVYESESYWDKEKQQPRARRKLIGKIDDETGEIIPTGKSGRKRDGANECTDQDHKALIESYAGLIQQKDDTIASQKKLIIKLTKEKNDILSGLEKLTKEYKE